MTKLIKYLIEDLKNEYKECMKNTKKSKKKKDKNYATVYNRGFVYGYLRALLCTYRITEEERNNVLTELGLEE